MLGLKYTEVQQKQKHLDNNDCEETTQWNMSILYICPLSCPFNLQFLRCNNSKVAKLRQTKLSMCQHMRREAGVDPILYSKHLFNLFVSQWRLLHCWVKKHPNYKLLPSYSICIVFFLWAAIGACSFFFVFLDDNSYGCNGMHIHTKNIQH